MHLLEKDPDRRPAGAGEAAGLFEPFLDPRAEKTLAGRLLARGFPSLPRIPAPAGSRPTAPTLAPTGPRWRVAIPAAGLTALFAASAILLLRPPGPGEGTSDPSAAGADGVAAARAGTPAPPPGPAPVPEEADPPPSAGGGDREPAPAPVERTGRVDVAANPWANVLFRGKKVGETPLVGLVLPAGSQTLVLENPVTGRSRAVALVVREGVNPAVTVDLTE